MYLSRHQRARHLRRICVKYEVLVVHWRIPQWMRYESLDKSEDYKTWFISICDVTGASYTAHNPVKISKALLSFYDGNLTLSTCLISKLSRLSSPPTLEHKIGFHLTELRPADDRNNQDNNSQIYNEASFSLEVVMCWWINWKIYNWLHTSLCKYRAEGCV